MANYLVGDIQGCDKPLERLLQKVDFSPSRDVLYVLGDMVNRGEHSLAVLERLMAMGSSAKPVLGNHDVHLLATFAGIRAMKRGDTFHEILQAPHCQTIIDWIRQQPLVRWEHGCLMLHAGVLPQWDLHKILELSSEVMQVLQSQEWVESLSQMYGNTPNQWSEDLSQPTNKMARLRLTVNALTRLRLCTTDGIMDFKFKEGMDKIPNGLIPWFDAPHRQTSTIPIFFGHWSALGKFDRGDVVGLDTGCVWGGCLSMIELQQTENSQKVAYIWHNVQCTQVRNRDEK